MKKLVWFGHLNCKKKIIFQQETTIYSIKILALFMVFEVFVIYYHKQKLFIDSLLVLSSQSLSFFVLFNSSQMYCLSKKYKSSLLWSLIKSHFYETSMHKNWNCFSSWESVWGSFYFPSSHKNSGQLRGWGGFNNKCVFMVVQFAGMMVMILK